MPGLVLIPEEFSSGKLVLRLQMGVQRDLVDQIGTT